MKKYTFDEISEKLNALNIDNVKMSRRDRMKNEISITVGLTTKHGELLDNQDTLEFIKTASAQALGFASIFKASGVYTYDDKYTSTEESIRIQAYVKDKDFKMIKKQFEKLAILLQRELEQESILYYENKNGAIVSYFIRERV